MDGIINVNKPAGMTSHDVVLRIRKILKHEKVGHCGTLDPQATGVLLICVGRATKLSQHFLHLDKTYWAQCRLGVTTESQDSEGQILETKEVPELSKDQIAEALKSFLGKQEQMPPMVSAKRHNGQRLYRLARKGVEVERKPVQIEIFDIELLDWETPVVTFKASVSSGTYIRTLCDDLGRKLDCGGHLSALDRVRVGNFHVDESRDLESLVNREKIAKALQGLPKILMEYKINLSRERNDSTPQQDEQDETDLNGKDTE